jgi:putative ABC transport system permease protein
VLGIAPPIFQSNFRQRQIDPTVYLPFRQQPLLAMSLIARTRATRESITSLMREEIRKIDADIPLFDILSIEDLLDRQNAGGRILSTLFSTFAAIALVLSAVGIYAVTAYSVSQRTQEIGVRMALGAERRDIVWLVLRQGIVHLAIGVPPGLAAGYGLSQLLRGQLFQVSPTDPITFVSITVFMITVVVVACLVPANRASRLNSAEAFRTE